MFYPPERLNVVAAEAYHDGKKGELSYYAPWGDVFMLYEDFYAGDEMHRLGIGLTGIDNIANMTGGVVIEKLEVSNEAQVETLTIGIEGNGNQIIFELNDSLAAKALYEQLPLSIQVENYSTNEKIFYPPEKLDTTDMPLANPTVGSLTYYAPWGDVAIFYGDYGSASGLYELGQATSGSEYISTLSGIIHIQIIE